MISSVPPRAPEQKHGFLQFSQKMDYGLFLLMELGKRQLQQNRFSSTVVEPLSLRAFAEENGMSFFFMQKAAFELRKAGLIHADRGKNGGYTLAKSVQNITLKEIVEILEGPVTVMHCLMTESPNCSRQTRCTLRHGLGAVNQTIVNLFTQTTLYQLLQSPWNQAV